MYAGLDAESSQQVDELLDNRLSASAMRSIGAALAKWDEVRARWSWPRIIISDDLHRGAKLATFVLHLIPSWLVWAEI